MIDINKQYRTRDGREVRIYAVDGGGHKPVHGAVREGENWVSHTWLYNGVAALDCNSLIEVKSRIKREVWVNVYPGPQQPVSWMFHDKETADSADLNAYVDRIACVKLTIDCEEGEGL